MKTKFTIGRNKENDFCIDAKEVSQFHLVVNYISAEEFQLEDNDSKNGTYVNGRQIKCKVVKPTIEVTLGTHPIDIKLIFQKILETIKKEKIDFSKEFDALKEVYDTHQKEVNRIKKWHRLKPLFLRTALGFILISISLIFLPPSYKYPVLVGIGLLTAIVAIVTVSDTKLKAAIEELTVVFEKKYVCPKCKAKLIRRSWEYWKKQKACPSSKCNARF